MTVTEIKHAAKQQEWKERIMAYRQERALLTGARLTLFDPYALASVGGVQSVQSSHQSAMQAVLERMNELRNQLHVGT